MHHYSIERRGLYRHINIIHLNGDLISWGKLNNRIETSCIQFGEFLSPELPDERRKQVIHILALKDEFVNATSAISFRV
jgi:hypothetical protein